MIKSVSGLIRGRWPTLFLLIYAVAGFATISGMIAWGDDWAQYVMHTRNLLAGIPYANIGYLFNPDAANVGPPSYPPGLPLLLAPVMAVFGMNLVALKATCFLCVVLSLPCMFKAFELDFGRTVAVVATILFAAHDQIFGLLNSISSEAPYLLATMLALWRLGRERAETWSAFAPALWSGISLGALAYLAVMCRSIGVSLLLAMLVYGWAQRRPIGWFTGLLASFVALVWLQKILLVAPATYGNELHRPTIDLLIGNVIGYWDALATIVRVPFGLSRIAALGACTLAVVGLVAEMRRRSVTQAVGGMRALAARVPASVFYACAYLAAVLVAAIAPQARYLWPVLPVLIAMVAITVMALTKRTPRPQVLNGVIAASVAVYYLALNASAPRLPAQEMANCLECNELYTFVGSHTPPGTIVAFAKPRAMALLGGRDSWAWPQDYTAQAFQAKLRAMHTGLLVIGAPGSRWAERNPPLDSEWGGQTASSREVVFRNNMFIAIRLGP